MNNNVDNLFKLLVPAILLVLWALNQLFNKENSPPAGRPGGGLGPRPGNRPTTPSLRPVPNATRPEITDPRNPYASNRSSPPPANEDEIVILRSETVRPPKVVPREPRRNPRQRPARPGPSPAEARSGRAAREPKRETPEPQPAATPYLSPPAHSLESPLLIGLTPPLAAPEVRRALTQRERIREAVMISELLRPPVALRGRHGLRLR